MRTIKVTVVYESGVKVTTRCKDFMVYGHDTRGITSIEWEDARPRPNAIGLDHVVAVWSKKSWWPW
ncbi:MAG: hypothetical protein V4636_17545 [Pseudomonadota bacterium]